MLIGGIGRDMLLWSLRMGVGMDGDVIRLSRFILIGLTGGLVMRGSELEQESVRELVIKNYLRMRIVERVDKKKNKS